MFLGEDGKSVSQGPARQQIAVRPLIGSANQGRCPMALRTETQDVARTHVTRTHQAPSRWRGRRPAVIAGVASVALLSGTAAFAYWTTGGSGSATATAGTTAAVTITGTVAGTIYPGGTFTVNFTATNPNNSPVGLGTISATAFDTNINGCDTLIANATFADFSMADVAANETVAANATNAALTATGSLVFGNSPTENQDACKGAVVTITLSATAGA